jgi:hypothetical protein
VTVRCPTCGADVEFRYDDSFVRVCGHCRAAVVRTDRGPETLGQFADPAQLASQLQLFAEGRYGTTGFQLIGMAQLRHAAGGVWQEWYARLDSGQWAWLSEAQGRIYLTFERADVAVPSIAQLAPGTPLELAGTPFTVAERGTATYTSALGEIPYRLVPGSTFQFVDLSDGRGGFATIDYNDGSEPPAVYLGYQVTPQGLGLSGGEAQPQLATPAQGARLACPNCNGSLELRAPDATLRIACPYCNTLVSVEGGTLSIIARQAKKPKLDIPLGTKGTFADGELTVIGYVARSACVEATWYPFAEYLLYAPAVGFRWLVCSDTQWSYVQPVASGAVVRDVHARYDGVTFRAFLTTELRVDSVLGEFYWRVQAGEKVRGEDYIAPPAMLSRESTAQEENWSLSTYLTPAEVERALGGKVHLPAAVGVAPNQPYPSGYGKVSALLVVALFAVAIGKCAAAPDVERLSEQFDVPVQATRPVVDPALGVVPDGTTADGEAPGGVMFSQPFHLDGGKNVAVRLSANLNNDWMYAAFDLVNDGTGGVITFDKSLEYYAGIDDGESWDEGSRTADEILAPLEPGDYTLRVEAQHGGTQPVTLRVSIRQGVFRWLWFALALGVLALPLLILAAHAASFRKKRWENSNLVHHASWSSDDD